MRALITTLALSCFLGCHKYPKKNDVAIKEGKASYEPSIEVFAEGLETPWAMAFSPDGRMFITERPGRLRIIKDGSLKKEPYAVIKDVVAKGESGLLGLALHPDFTTNSWLYLCYTYDKQGRMLERVVRYREANHSLVDQKIILDDIPAAHYHDGCRIKFGPDKKLYITTGDATKAEYAQDLSSLAGKTLRINEDGSIPLDNPFVKKPHARGEIWSYGHRNAQGLDWQPGSHLMVQTEHGPSGFDGPGGGDEVNFVEKGKNYGWPIIHHDQTQTGLMTPILQYTKAVAPAGATFYTGQKIAAWHHDFFFACLRGERVIRVRFKDGKVIETENLFTNYGRIRDVIEGPDGALYIATSNRDGRGTKKSGDDKILRIR